MSAKTATIIGSTGLIGSYLLEHLKEHNSFSTIKLLVRRPVKNDHPKVQIKLIDFDDHESFKLGIEGSHVVFCAIGTTQAKVKGDKEAYRKVDYNIPVRAAQFCKVTGCEQFLLVSSVGADSKSKNFYLQLKGEVEDAVKDMKLDSVSMFRPSLLLGNRQEARPGEKMGQVLMPLFSFLMMGSLKRYKPIHAEDVAQAMIAASNKQRGGFHIYQHNEMKKLLKII